MIVEAQIFLPFQSCYSLQESHIETNSIVNEIVDVVLNVNTDVEVANVDLEFLAETFSLYEL